MVSYKRHLVKSISYRFLGSFQTIVISYILTNDISLSATFGVFELVLKPLLYFIHERIWYKYFKYGIYDNLH